VTHPHPGQERLPAARPSPDASPAPLLSVVIPLYNEAAMMGILAERLAGLAEALKPLHCEFILVDDGSRDRTAALAEEFAARDPRVTVLSLSRNFGHQMAITAGLDFARGDAVVFMDADLQDPPEVVPQMVARWQEGYDVVYGRRIKRESDTLFKRLSAWAFYKLLRFTAKVDIPDNVADFRLLSRRAADALRAMPEHHRLLRGLCAWIGFRQTCVDYERPPRAAGETKYTLGKMTRLALDSIFSFSWFPLRLASIAGLLVTAASTLWILVHVILRLFTSAHLVPGWTSTVALVGLLGGMNLLALGVLGEYVGRIFEEVKHRPLYCIRKVTSTPPQSPRPPEP
jgi:polyisoprenyl-phosphate glycosyltransferase